MADTSEIDGPTYEELASIELELEDIDTEIVAKQYLLSQATYAKRTALVSRIPHFWPLVLEQSPPEIDSYIQPSDSAVFAQALKSITLSRFEIPETATADSKRSELGEPRSVSFRFEFGENEWFEEQVIEKKFWWRRGSDGFAGRVSEPVSIKWKKGKDLTEGLLDASVRLWEAQKKAGALPDGENLTPVAKKAKSEKIKEWQELKKLVDASVEGSLSFFTWFGFRGRYIGPEEARKASEKYAAELEGKKNGGGNMDVDAKKEADHEVDEYTGFEMETEVFPDGDELAITLLEDVWPNAIKYFTEAQELGSDVSGLDFEDDDISEDDEDDEANLSDNLENIRNLVKGRNGKDAGGPPSKKRKT